MHWNLSAGKVQFKSRNFANKIMMQCPVYDNTSQNIGFHKTRIWERFDVFARGRTLVKGASHHKSCLSLRRISLSLCPRRRPSARQR